MVNPIRKITTVNPLHDNNDIQKLRSAHRLKFARIDQVKTKPWPLKVGHIIEYASKFW